MSAVDPWGLGIGNWIRTGHPPLPKSPLPTFAAQLEYRLSVWDLISMALRLVSIEWPAQIKQALRFPAGQQRWCQSHITHLMCKQSFQPISFQRFIRWFLPPRFPKITTLASHHLKGTSEEKSSI